MIWVFPMAGKGARTQQLGQFKPFIGINGCPMLGWLFRSIAAKIEPQDTLIFITTQLFADEFDVERNLRRILDAAAVSNGFELIRCKQTPPGPSASVYQACSWLDTDETAMVVNCDQYIDFEGFEYSSDKQGFLPVYANFGDKSSYVQIQEGRIVRIVEKQNISCLASAGVYGVASGKALLFALEQQFARKQLTREEYFVGPALNNLIQEGFEFYPTSVRAKYDLGSINGIEAFTRSALCRMSGP